MHVKGCPCEALFICCYCCRCPQQQGSDALLHYAYAKRGEFFFFLASRLVRSKFFYHDFSIPLFDCIDLIVLFVVLLSHFFPTEFPILPPPPTLWPGLHYLLSSHITREKLHLVFFPFRYTTSHPRKREKKKRRRIRTTTTTPSLRIMLTSVLRRSAADGTAKAITTIPSIERAGAYLRFSTLRMHPHHEPNYRARPVGWKGWNSKQYMDPWAPFALTTPVRHVDRPFSGIWFGMGHFALKNFFGPLHWKFWLRVSFLGVVGWIYALGTYALRMHRNGWEWKNRGAVFSME